MTPHAKPADSTIQAQILEQLMELKGKVEESLEQGRENGNELKMLRRELGLDGQHGRLPIVEATLIRHEQALFAQAQQSAACNASHTVEARLSRWLLRAHDLSGTDTLSLTQEFLGQMLGVQRSTVSIVANTLQQAGLISYSRGRIEIVNLGGLQEACCECYGTVKAHYDRLVNNAS